jgi:hypothetical protein
MRFIESDGVVQVLVVNGVHVRGGVVLIRVSVANDQCNFEWVYTANVELVSRRIEGLGHRCTTPTTRLRVSSDPLYGLIPFILRVPAQGDHPVDPVVENEHPSTIG